MSDSNIADLRIEQIAAILPGEVNTAQNVLTVNWNIGRRCNFSCSYCPKDLHDRVSPDLSFNQLVLAWNNIVGAMQPKSMMASVEFTGGEPTLNPHFLQFATYLNRNHRDKIWSVGVTTNGSASAEYYGLLMKEFDWIAFSTHFEWWDEPNFMATLLDIWRTTGRNQRGKWLIVNLMYEEWSAESVNRIAKILKAEKIPFNPFHIRNYYGSKGIKNKQKRQFDYEAYLEAERLQDGSTEP